MACCPTVHLCSDDGVEVLGVLTPAGVAKYLLLPQLTPYEGDVDELSLCAGGGPVQSLAGPVVMRAVSDDSTLTEGKTLPDNNQLLIDNSSTATGVYPGITMFSREGSCGHIHYSFPNDCWCGELDMNGPTREWSIRLGDTPVDARKRRVFVVNKHGEFWLGRRDDADAQFDDFTDTDFDIAPAQAQLEVHSPPEFIETKSQIRATVDYGPGEGATITGGLVDDFYINQFAIRGDYQNNWSSIVRFGVRDTTAGQDLGDNFRGICDLLELHGDGGHVVLPKLPTFVDDASAAAALPARAIYSVGTDLRITP